MGQSIVALMYGVRESKLPMRLRDEAGDWIWDYCPEPKKRINHNKSPHSAYEGDVLGFPVAASRGRNDDEGELGETVALSQVERVHAKHIQAARKKWDHFAKWLKEVHGEELPIAELWLTTDERA
jgi:hypothetical protein